MARWQTLRNSVLSLTAVSMLGQLASVVTQMVAASYFGSDIEMDAYVAASAAPQYLVAVISGAITAVMVPWLTDRMQHDPDSVDTAASQVLTWCVLVFGSLALIAAIFADPILQTTAPGLPLNSREVAVNLARISWPVAPCLACSMILAGLAQVRGRFDLTAWAPTLAAIVGLATTVVVAHLYGAYGLAWSTTVAGIVQCGVGFLSLRRFRVRLFPLIPEIKQLILLAAPILITGLLVRATPLVDRGLASNLSAGALSHVNYASKMVMILSTVLSAGITTVAFPAMAFAGSAMNKEKLMDTAGRSARSMWLLIAPVVGLGSVLAIAIVEVVFQRGKFRGIDTASVGALLQIYFLALVGMTMGVLTSRILYSLKATRVLAIASILESLAYVGYASWLTQRYGAIGIAWSSVILFGASIVWHALFAYWHTRAWLPIGAALSRMTLAALVGSGIAYGVTLVSKSSWVHVLVGGGLGLLSYVLLVRWMCPEEWASLFKSNRAPGQAVVSPHLRETQEQLAQSLPS